MLCWPLNKFVCCGLAGQATGGDLDQKVSLLDGAGESANTTQRDDRDSAEKEDKGKVSTVAEDMSSQSSTTGQTNQGLI